LLVALRSPPPLAPLPFLIHPLTWRLG
jgi:hypothetical protein